MLNSYSHIFVQNNESIELLKKYHLSADLSIAGDTRYDRVLEITSSDFKNERIEKANHFTLEIDHFNQCIINNTAPKLSLGDALWNTKTLEAIQASIKTKAWVNF